MHKKPLFDKLQLNIIPKVQDESPLPRRQKQQLQEMLKRYTYERPIENRKSIQSGLSGRNSCTKINTFEFPETQKPKHRKTHSIVLNYFKKSEDLPMQPIQINDLYGFSKTTTKFL
ncbi:hypothetical protein pb186bvf_005583 [Paramecium bursaria]